MNFGTIKWYWFQKVTQQNLYLGIISKANTVLKNPFLKEKSFLQYGLEFFLMQKLYIAKYNKVYN